MKNQKEEQEINRDNPRKLFPEYKIELWLDRPDTIPNIHIEEILNDPKKSDDLTPEIKLFLARFAFLLWEKRLPQSESTRYLELSAYLGNHNAHIAIAHIECYRSYYALMSTPIKDISKHADQCLLKSVITDAKITSRNYDKIIQAYRDAQKELDSKNHETINFLSKECDSKDHEFIMPPTL